MFGAAMAIRLGAGFSTFTIDGLKVTSGAAVDFGALVEAVNDRVLADARVENVLLTVRDGMNLVWRA